MEFLQIFRGWRRIWLVAAVVYPLLLVAVAYSVFPSRADIERAWLNKAIAIEKQFDPSASAMSHAMLRARFAGVPDRVAVNRIREDLHAAQPSAAHLRPTTFSRNGAVPGQVMQHVTGRLLWFDPAHTLTGEGLDSLKDEFARADVLFMHRLETRPRQILHASIAAMSLAGFTLALLYVFGLLVEWSFPRGRMRPEPAIGARAGLGIGEALSRAGEGLRETLDSLRARSRL